MTERTLIRNVRVIDNEIRPGSLLIEDGRILSLLPPGFTVEANTVVDGEGAYAAPGLIELHSHGAAGYDFMDGTQQAYREACDMHLRHGVTTLLPTTVASGKEEYLRTLDSFAAAKESRKDKQCLLGMHFEGPYFPLARSGGMLEQYISDPKPELYLPLMDYAQGNIARWSAAPELPGAAEFGDACRARGILPSMAHSDATIRDVRKAMAHGFTHVTHLYSDMSTITRESGFRVLGLLESAFALRELWVEIISDGCHLPPELFRLIYELIGYERLQLCSDSIRPAGTDAKEVIVGSLDGGGTRGIIEDGVAKFLDRSAFLGSIALGLDLVKVAHEKVGIPLPQAIAMMSENPAKILGIADRKGRLRVGMDADVILFGEDLQIRRVFYRGRPVVQA